jgi:hypothetical protein
MLWVGVYPVLASNGELDAVFGHYALHSLLFYGNTSSFQFGCYPSITGLSFSSVFLDW